jgi:hypothetical protein
MLASLKVPSADTVFYIIAQLCYAMVNQIKDITSWQKVRIGTQKYEIASLKYT